MMMTMEMVFVLERRGNRGHTLDLYSKLDHDDLSYIFNGRPPASLVTPPVHKSCCMQENLQVLTCTLVKSSPPPAFGVYRLTNTGYHPLAHGTPYP